MLNIFYLWIVLMTVLNQIRSQTTVETKYGPVRGTLKKDDLGTSYHAFYGIPFAKPPVGELRFKVTKVENWV